MFIPCLEGNFITGLVMGRVWKISVSVCGERAGPEQAIKKPFRI